MKKPPSTDSFTGELYISFFQKFLLLFNDISFKEEIILIIEILLNNRGGRSTLNLLNESSIMLIPKSARHI